MDLSSLATSLQTSTRLTKAEKDLMEKFRGQSLAFLSLARSPPSALEPAGHLAQSRAARGFFGLAALPAATAEA